MQRGDRRRAEPRRGRRPGPGGRGRGLCGAAARRPIMPTPGARLDRRSRRRWGLRLRAPRARRDQPLCADAGGCSTPRGPESSTAWRPIFGRRSARPATCGSRRREIPVYGPVGLVDRVIELGRKGAVDPALQGPGRDEPGPALGNHPRPERPPAPAGPAEPRRFGGGAVLDPDGRRGSNRAGSSSRTTRWKWQIWTCSASAGLRRELHCGAPVRLRAGGVRRGPLRGGGRRSLSAASAARGGQPPPRRRHRLGSILTENPMVLYPLSTGSTAPVIHPALGDARKATSSATSSGSPGAARAP